MTNTSQSKRLSKPKVKFYIGEDGIRQAFRESGWKDSCKDTYVMWPTKEMVGVLTPEFSKRHSAQRLKYNVRMHIIRKDTDRNLDKEEESFNDLYHSEGWTTNREIRYAPKDASWSISYWIYDDMCLFASSSGERFAFIVYSKEFAETMILLWQQMWKNSKE